MLRECRDRGDSSGRRVAERQRLWLLDRRPNCLLQHLETFEDVNEEVTIIIAHEAGFPADAIAFLGDAPVDEVPLVALGLQHLLGTGIQTAFHVLGNLVASGFDGSLLADGCLLYTSPSPRDGLLSRMPSSA